MIQNGPSCILPAATRAMTGQVSGPCSILRTNLYGSLKFTFADLCCQNCLVRAVWVNKQICIYIIPSTEGNMIKKCPQSTSGYDRHRAVYGNVSPRQTLYLTWAQPNDRQFESTRIAESPCRLGPLALDHTRLTQLGAFRGLCSKMFLLCIQWEYNLVE